MNASEIVEYLNAGLENPNKEILRPIFTRDEAQLLVNALRHPEAKPSSIPDGWKLVPVEPTEAMTLAARDARPYCEDDADPDSMDKNTGSTWAAMLDSAPLYVNTPTKEK